MAQEGTQARGVDTALSLQRSGSIETQERQMLSQTDFAQRSLWLKIEDSL